MDTLFIQARIGLNLFCKLWNAFPLQLNWEENWNEYTWNVEKG